MTTGESCSSHSVPQSFVSHLISTFTSKYINHRRLCAPQTSNFSSCHTCPLISVDAAPVFVCVAVWHGGILGRVLDLQLRGRRFHAAVEFTHMFRCGYNLITSTRRCIDAVRLGR